MITFDDKIQTIQNVTAFGSCNLPKLKESILDISPNLLQFSSFLLYYVHKTARSNQSIFSHEHCPQNDEGTPTPRTKYFRVRQQVNFSPSDYFVHINICRIIFLTDCSPTTGPGADNITELGLQMAMEQVPIYTSYFGTFFS